MCLWCGNSAIGCEPRLPMGMSSCLSLICTGPPLLQRPSGPKRTGNPDSNLAGGGASHRGGAVTSCSHSADHRLQHCCATTFWKPARQENCVIEASPGALQVQRNLRLCIKRDLTEHDIVSRIMRKDNYLIGALVARMALYLMQRQHGVQDHIAVWVSTVGKSHSSASSCQCI
jgi:Autophagy protein ATG9